jgi:two-component system response regulator YesN
MYKLLIIDDEPLIQAGIRSMVDWNEIGVDVCGVASNGKLGWEIIEDKSPDIIITDIKMPVMTGLELLKKARDSYPDQDYPAFIILTSYEEFQMAKEAITYNATDYLVKIDLTPEVLKAAVLRAINSLPKNISLFSGNETLSSSTVQSFRDKFFIRLLHNLYESPSQFEALSVDLNIAFSYSAYQCCYFEMQNDSVDRMDISKQVLLYSNSYQLLMELSAKYFDAYFLNLDRKHGAIIVLYNETPATDSDLILINNLKQICESINSYYQTTLKIGVGTIVNEPLMISESYQAAQLAFGQVKDDRGIASSTDKALNHHVVENVKDYIKKHITQKLSLNDIAALYGISPNYLSALFKKYNSCGYSEYITEQKIAKAKRMLTEDNLKVYEVADALGFESAFYFSKVFKKVTGTSPSEYLNEH